MTQRKQTMAYWKERTRVAEAERARLREEAGVMKAWAEDYKAQRDTLLAALRKIAMTEPIQERVPRGFSTAADIARSAIAKVEGEK